MHSPRNIIPSPRETAAKNDRRNAMSGPLSSETLACRTSQGVHHGTVHAPHGRDDMSCLHLRSNRAAAYLALGMWDEALKDAERARMLAEDALKRTHKAAPLYIKTFAQKGEALIGEGR